MAWMAPIGFSLPFMDGRGAEEPLLGVWSGAPFVLPLETSRGLGIGGRVCEGCTCTGNQPPGAWVIFASSRPRKRGMEGPVRSMSRIPTEWPASDSESATWVVIEDLPTPPLPERT